MTDEVSPAPFLFFFSLLTEFLDCLAHHSCSVAVRFSGSGEEALH